MPTDLAELAAAIGRAAKEQNPEAYGDWPDAELGAQLLIQHQGQVHGLFQGSNEKDPQGNAVVRPNQYGQALQEQTPPLAFLAPYLERGMDLLRGATGIGDQGPAGPTWTNAGQLLAAVLPFAPKGLSAVKAAASGERAAEEAAQAIRVAQRANEGGGELRDALTEIGRINQATGYDAYRNTARTLSDAGLANEIWRLRSTSGPDVARNLKVALEEQARRGQNAMIGQVVPSRRNQEP
jgi:hypothetical protein